MCILRKVNNLLKLEDQAQIVVGILAGAVIGSGSIQLGGFWWNLVLVFAFGSLNFTGALLINQCVDAAADRINKPYRLIPEDDQTVARFLTSATLAYFASLVIAILLGVFYAGIWAVATVMGCAYSWKALGVRRNFIFANTLLTACYVLLTFVSGWHGVAPVGRFPWLFILLLCCIDFAEACVKDYRDIQGDHAAGMDSMPLRFGYSRGAFINAVLYLVPLILTVLLAFGHWIDPRFGIMAAVCAIIGSIAFWFLLTNLTKDGAITAYRMVTANYFVVRTLGAWAFLD